MQTKKLNFYRQLIAITMFILMLISCGTDDPKVDKSSLLVGAKWTFSESIAEDELIQGLITSLYLGSTFTFNANGSYNGEFGDWADNVAYEGTWEFTSDDTKIILDKGTDEENTWDIVTLNSDTFSFKDGNFTLTYSK
jgi:Lipocalin-like domain